MVKLGVNSTLSINSTLNPLYHEQKAALITLYLGSAFSVAFLICALLFIATNPYLRTKRSSIINMNLCVCLLIFYFGFMLALQQESPRVLDDNGHANEYIVGLCLAGSMILVGGWISTGFWLLVGWYYYGFLQIYCKTKHVTKFFLKFAIPVYTLTLVIIMCVVGIYFGEEKFEIQKESIGFFFVKNRRSFTMVKTVVIIIVVIIAAFIIHGILKITVLIEKDLACSTIKKRRVSFMQMSILSFVIVCTQIPFFIVWQEKSYSAENVYKAELAGGVCSALQGFVVAMFLVLYKENKTDLARPKKTMLDFSGSDAEDAENGDSPSIEDQATMQKMEPRIATAKNGVC